MVHLCYAALFLTFCAFPVPTKTQNEANNAQLRSMIGTYYSSALSS